MRRSTARSGARIAALGAYVPERIVTNHDLEQVFDTSDEWIVTRSGIRERRVSADDEFTSDLCVRAVRDLHSRSPDGLTGVELIIACTTTPDYAFPSVACLVQAELGLRNTGAIDLNATCAGFAYGLHIANGLVTAGIHKRVLIVAGETLSKVVDNTDRATAILFGDGAGAALVESDKQGRFLASHLGADGEGAAHLYRTGLSSRLAPVDNTGLIRQNGRQVYRWAVETVAAGAMCLVKKAGLRIDEIDWFVPHSANLRITEAVCERIGFPIERTLSSLTYYGNTSSATIPLALVEGARESTIKNGDRVLLYGFGGGLVHAGVLVEWALHE